MFSSRVNPSPTQTSIKEANNHLQLLHNKVKELEKIVKEQAELLIKKDEVIQNQILEITNLKDHEIELQQINKFQEDKITKLEASLSEKDAQYEQLNQRVMLIDEITGFAPSLEKLLTSIKKLSPKKNKHPSPSTKLKPKTRAPISRKHVNQDGDVNKLDGVIFGYSSYSYDTSDLSIGRSFNINSNFSEDEDDEML
ncbi:hypothetical protein LAZ67_2000087 [Cordylochernes scorpioides]|uniref:Uncharacterized protein n=1 Tax=Cordylochernes scorpioides TaxID=51811 RepID=A0ABY6K3E5_9ARAC|nr:hypothetical protein LAZ67_2000087 [Cordylochernes scorpioides]